MLETVALDPGHIKTAYAVYICKDELFFFNRLTFKNCSELSPLNVDFK